MNTQVIDRIKDYCTEVTSAQWEELVRVADEVGVNVYDRFWSFGTSSYVHLNARNFIMKTGHTYTGRTVMTFPDFLAKLRGEEWKPKAGEMVEVSDDGDFWQPLEYIDKRNNYYVCWNGGLYPQTTCFWKHCRPITPTITRAEAEAQLGKRIID